MAAKHTFIPTPYEIVSYMLVAIVILGLLTLEPIIKNTNAGSYTFLSDTVGQWFSTNIVKLNTPRVTAVLTYVLWAIVGALVYLLVWAIMSLYKSVQEDVSPFHNLMPPQGYKPKQGLHTRIARSIIRLVGVLGIFFMLGFFFSKILPLSVDQFVTSLTRIDGLSILGLFLSVLYVAAGLFAFTILLRLVMLRRRVFDSQV